MKGSRSGIIALDRNNAGGFQAFLWPKRDEHEELILGYLAQNNAAAVLQARVVDGTVLLDRVYVSAPLRRSGIGTLLMNDLKERVKHAGIKKIIAPVSFTRMSKEEALAAEMFIAMSGFEEIGSMPVMMCTLSDILNGPYKPLSHEVSSRCIRLRDVSDGQLRMSQTILTRNGSLPPVKKMGHLRESVAYVENDSVKGCLILDAFTEDSDSVVISDIRSDNGTVMRAMINAAVADFSHKHSETTTVYASPADDRMKEFIMKASGERAVTLTESRNYLFAV